MPVPKTRTAVEVVNNLATKLSSVLSESSRTVCFLGLVENSFGSLRTHETDRQSIGGHREAAPEKKDGMFAHPTWNAFALMLPISWLLNDKTYRRMITRNGPVQQILEDEGTAVKNLAPQPQVG